MRRRWEISRRFLLRGAGASLALPMLDVMEPSVKRAHAQGAASPKRWVMWHFPSGHNQAMWTPPGGMGMGEKNWELSPTLAPLGDLNLKNEVTVIQGLRAPYADGFGAGHTCGISGQLSGFLCPNEVSENRRTIDQGIAQAIGKDTKIPSLQLGTAILYENPNDEPGYSANIKDHLSWKNDTTPLPKQVDPAIVFERLFGDVVDTDEDAIAAQRRQRLRQSILDSVLTEAATLKPKLGSADRAKLDQYLENVREVEQSIQLAPRDNTSGACDAQARVGTFRAPDDIEDHVRQMNQLMALALRCDVTRVIVFQYETTVTTIQHSFLNVRAPFHLGVAHHGNDPARLNDYFLVNRWLVSQYGEFLKLLEESPDGEDSTLLDNSVVVMTSELGDGDRHDHINLPCLVGGGRNLGVNPGRYLLLNGQFMQVLIDTAQAVGAGIDEWGYNYFEPDNPPIPGGIEGFLG